MLIVALPITFGLDVTDARLVAPNSIAAVSAREIVAERPWAIDMVERPYAPFDRDATLRSLDERDTTLHSTCRATLRPSSSSDSSPGRREASQQASRCDLKLRAGGADEAHMSRSGWVLAYGCRPIAS